MLGCRTGGVNSKSRRASTKAGRCDASHVTNVSCVADSTPNSANFEQLVSLQAEAPARVLEAVLKGGLHVPPRLGGVSRVEGLEHEVLEVELDEALRLGGRMALRIDELELVAPGEHERRIGLRAHADVVDAGGRQPGAVGLDGDFEASRVQCVDGIRIELEQRLAPGADHQRATSDRASLGDR